MAQMLATEMTPAHSRFESITGKFVGIVKCVSPACDDGKDQTIYVPWPIFAFLNHEDPNIMKSVGFGPFDVFYVRHPEQNYVHRPPGCLITSKLHHNNLLKGGSFRMARCLTQALSLQIGWSKDADDLFLVYANQGLGRNPSHDKLCKFVNSLAFQRSVRLRAEESNIFNVTGVQVGKASRAWQRLKTPLFTREISSSQLRMAESEKCPQIMQCLDRRGLEHTVLVTHGIKSDGSRSSGLSVWDSSDAFVSDGRLPSLIFWNRVQLDIISVVASYPVRVTTKPQLSRTHAKNKKRKLK
jgi:hypothetical protein